MVHPRSDHINLARRHRPAQEGGPGRRSGDSAGGGVRVRGSRDAGRAGQRSGHRPGDRPGHRPSPGPGAGLPGRHGLRDADPGRRALPHPERTRGQLHADRRAHRHAHGNRADHGPGGPVHHLRPPVGGGGAWPGRDRGHRHRRAGAPPRSRHLRGPGGCRHPGRSGARGRPAALRARPGRGRRPDVGNVRLRLTDPPARQRERGDVEPAPRLRGRRAHPQ